jgi:hypothetical protein
MTQGEDNGTRGDGTPLHDHAERAGASTVPVEDPRRQLPTTDGPIRTFIRQLESTDAIAAEVQKACCRLGLRTAADRARVEEDLKLQYYFGGRDVAYLRMPEGKVVVAAGTLGTEEFRKTLLRLSPEERRHVIVYSPDPWDEGASLAPTPFADEG